MKNRRIGVTVARTINLGEYESLRVEASYSCDVSDADIDDFAGYATAWHIAEEQIRIESEKLVKQLTNKRTNPRRRGEG